MRYLVRARVKTGRKRPLLGAIRNGTLGAIGGGPVRWVGICHFPDANGTELWAGDECDGTKQLECEVAESGESLVGHLRAPALVPCDTRR
jgi:hypothetical protein